MFWHNRQFNEERVKRIQMAHNYVKKKTFDHTLNHLVMTILMKKKIFRDHP